MISQQQEIVGPNGSSAGLGNELDLLVLKQLRARSSVVATSARTANAEQYRLPNRGKLLIFGNRTRLQSARISNGEERLTVVGDANAHLGIPGTRHLDRLGLDVAGIRQAFQTRYHAEPMRIHFEFGTEGLSAVEGQLSSFFCTAPNLNAARSFVERKLPSHELVIELEIGELSLSWWQRRGSK